MGRSSFVVGIVCSALLSSTALGDFFSVQVVNDGVDGGVSFSWLTTGTGNNGANASNAWHIVGSIVVDFDPTGGANGGGSINLFGGAQDLVIVSSGGTAIGTLTINDFFLEDPGDFDDGVLGFMEITASSNGISTALDDAVSADDHAFIEYLDRNYGSSGNGFNGFGINAGELTLRLWGNETVAANFGNTSTNWGTDWSSNGQLVIPAPGAAFLGMLGFGAIGWVRRRVA